ncbi:MAG: TonB family protein [Novosphingobium sp.]|uniref:TonB family protein n=1 Tax=Novosphingobium sp. TaxID=1874826 RepID=UPI0017B3ED65|nr:TonB family protein [Novosphingobium sp.]
MAYVDTVNAKPRIGAAGSVAVIQIALGAALIAGLTTTFQPRTSPKPPIVTNYPLPTPTPVETAPAVDPKPLTRPVHETRQVLPPHEAEFTPVVPLGGGEEALGGSGTGIGDLRLPIPDPAPSPALPVRGAKPRGKPGLWVTPNDYPAAELRLEHTGVTRFRLSVGLDGRVTDCTVTGSSGWPALDATACAKLGARAKFDPAIDSTGARIAGSYSSSVRWQIPE